MKTINAFSLSMNLMVREVGKQAVRRKIQCMEQCTTLTVSRIVEIVELKCSKCRDEKHHYKRIPGFLRNSNFHGKAS